jgi:hypothetical protein
MINLKPNPFFVLLFFSVNFIYSQFTPGNLVVLQAGNGATTPTSTGNQIIFNEYSTGGSATYSVAIPTTSANALIIRGNATSEGYISRSVDGNYIVFGGYVQTLPNTSPLNSSAPGTINRGVGLLDAAGNYSLIATSSASFAGSDMRGAAATNSANVWASSSSFGANYFGNASSATNVQSTKTNLRAIHIFNNQLYISSQVSTGTPTDIGVYAVGSGTPNSSGQTVTTIINSGTGAQPGQFFFNTAGNICYVADARNTTGGGIQKWILSSGTWSLAYTLSTGTANIGAFGVVADFTGNNPTVYATTTETSANRLIAVLDLGANSTATTLATATTSNTIFRGLAWSPGSSTCIPVSVITTSNNAPICSIQSLSLNVNAAGSAPITYTWLGVGAINSNSIANPVINNASSGTYTVLLANACGSSSAGINVNVNPTPTLLVNAASICAGGVATITASGANTYTWNNNTTNPSFTASPASTTNYTLNGTSGAGCAANTVTTTITVVAGLSLTINSPTICVGNNATITAQGASTYTWTNLTATTGIVVVSPTTNTSYTVSANASGCANTVSAVSMVVVNPLPTVAIVNTQKQICLQQVSVTLIGSPTGGVFSGTAVNGSIFTPNVVGSYSIVYSYTNSNNCSNNKTEVFIVQSCLGNSENLQFNKWSIFPNPAFSKLTIKGLNSEVKQIELFDVYGHVVFKTNEIQENNEIDIRFLPQGVYFVLLNGSLNGAQRFIKE